MMRFLLSSALCITVVAALVPAARADLYSAAKIAQVVESLISSADRVRSAYTTAWSETLYDQLEGASGKPNAKPELQRTLENAARTSETFRKRLRAIGELATERERIAALEELAEAVMRERWRLAVVDVRHHVALTRQRLAREESGAGVYGGAARRLLEEREAILRSVGSLLESARADGRSDAWELWADFADSVLQAGAADGVPTQLDSFLGASVVEHYDKRTGQRKRFDMAPLFEPLAVVYPAEDAKEYPKYPEGYFEVDPPGILGVLEVRSSATRDAKATAELLAQFRRDYKTLLDEDVAPPTGPSARVLVAFGHGIAPQRGRLPDLTESDPWIDYRVIHAVPAGSIPPDERKDDAFRRLKRVLQELAPAGASFDDILAMDHVIVLAEPREGAVPAVRSFALGGYEGTWFQALAPLQSAAGGTVHIRRVFPDGDVGPLNHLFLPDHVVVELRLNRKIEADGIDVSLARYDPGTQKFEPVDADGASGVTARRDADDPTIYRSDVLQVWDAAKKRPAWAGRNGVVSFGVRIDEWLMAAVHPSTAVLAFPTHADVKLDPKSVGHDWAAAVKAAAALGKTPFRLASTDKDEVTTVQAAFRALPGDQSVRITTGDHAAMTLLRDELRRQLMSRRRDLERVHESIQKDPEEAVRWFCEDLKRQIDQGNRALALMPISSDWLEPIALGDLFKSDPYPANQKLRKLYVDTARSIAKRSRELLAEAIEACETTGDDDYLELILLAGLGTRPIADLVAPDAVYAVAIDGVPRWKRHKLAREHLRSVETLFIRVTTIQDYASKQIEMILLVATAGTVAAELVGARLVVFCAEGAILGVTAYEKIPAYFASVDEVRFATATGGILAHERVELAKRREGSPALTALEVVATGVGAGAALRNLARGTRFTTHVRTAEVLFADGPRSAREMRGLTARAKAAACAVWDVLGTDVEVLARKLSPTARRNAAATLARIERNAENLRLRRWYDETAPPGLQVSVERPGRSAPQGEGLRVTARLPDGTRATHLLGEELGSGANAVVYGSRTAPDQVVKLLRRFDPSDADRALANGVAAIAEKARISTLLEEAQIPHLHYFGGGRTNAPVRVSGGVVDEPVFFSIQERIPAGAQTLRYRRVPVDGRPGCTAIRGVEGVHPGQPLPRDIQHAILRLYKKLGKAKLVAEDLHLENLYFFRDGVRIQAGILDLERVARFGARGEEGSAAFDALLKFDRYARNIQSMDGAPRLARALRWENMIDADFFMQKMLEHKNFVRYEALSGKWQGILLELDIVERYFPEFRMHFARNLDTIRAARQGAR